MISHHVAPDNLILISAELGLALPKADYLLGYYLFQAADPGI